MSLVVAERIAQAREILRGFRTQGRSVGLVPTMGALHRGHARLIEQAGDDCNVVVVSIFVNPLQFGPKEDYGRYPRPIDADLELCRQRNVDVVLCPTAEEMYPLEQAAFVEVPLLTNTLCGAHRPGHFRGVATVVLKLLNIVQPDRAYFGEKDMQQLAVIRRMAYDLNLPAEIVGIPIVREADGLALSSRNRYLNESERRTATVLYRALLQAREQIEKGGTEAGSIRDAAARLIASASGARLEYLEIVDDSMQPVDRIAGPVHIAGAIWLGSTRLIDNIFVPVNALRRTLKEPQ